MKKIIINESQFKRLILEVGPEGPGDEDTEEETEKVASIETPEGEEETEEVELDDENYDEEGNFIGKTQEEISPEELYIDSKWLEGIEVEYDSKKDTTTVGLDPWKYGKDQKRTRHKSNWWKSKGINTERLGGKINKFASKYIEHMANNIDLAVGPVVTSGYRGPKSQINAMYKQWKAGYKDDDTSYIKRTYRRSYEVLGKTIEHYFNSYKEGPAKRAAAAFLRRMEKKKKYISNHQLRGAIDISLFINSKHNDEIKTFLEKAQRNKWISSFKDERLEKGGPHFHIKLA